MQPFFCEHTTGRKATTKDFASLSTDRIKIKKPETSPTYPLGTLIDASIMNGFETITKLCGYILLFSHLSKSHKPILVLSTYGKIPPAGNRGNLHGPCSDCSLHPELSVEILTPAQLYFVWGNLYFIPDQRRLKPKPSLTSSLLGGKGFKLCSHLWIVLELPFTHSTRPLRHHRLLRLRTGCWKSQPPVQSEVPTPGGSDLRHLDNSEEHPGTPYT